MPSQTQPIPWGFDIQNCSQPVQQRPGASACLRPPDYGNKENVNVLSPGGWDEASCAPRVPPWPVGGRAGLPLARCFAEPSQVHSLSGFTSCPGGRTRRKKKGAKLARRRSSWPCLAGNGTAGGEALCPALAGRIWTRPEAS